MSTLTFAANEAPHPSRLGPATALLVIDLDVATASGEGGFARRLRELGRSTKYFEARLERILPVVSVLSGRVRRSGGPVVWVRPEFRRPGAGDWPRSYRASVAGLGFEEPMHEGVPGFEMLPGLAVDEADGQVTKKCVSAFWGGSAGSILRNQGVTDVLVCGCMTNTGVLVNAVDATGNGFRTTVIDDGCAALSAEVHEASLELMAPMYARATANEIQAAATTEQEERV
jgi:nicotinamidase-related amidase